MSLLAGTDLTRRFGPFTAVDGVSIHVEAGEVVGLLGANGAGKTTLLRMLLGLLAPTEGRVEFLGQRPSRATRGEVGYVPQHLGLYADLTVGGNRRFHHQVFGLATPEHHDGLAELADQALVGDLPLGAQRRLAFDLALAHDPRLLVLDEPTSGVGPLGRARLWEAIGGAADDGRAVLVTTHHLAEAEQCDRLVVMAAGDVVATGTADRIIGGAQAVVVSGPAPGPVLTALGQAGLVGALSAGGVAVPGEDTEAVRAALTDAGLDGEVNVRPATLEERFAELAAAGATRGLP